MKPLLAALLLAGAARAEEVPRLAGLFVQGEHRAAIFESPPGQMLTVREGEGVGSYRVRAIGQRGVELEQRGRTMLVTPIGSDAARAPVDTGGATFGLVVNRQIENDE